MDPVGKELMAPPIVETSTSQPEIAVFITTLAELNKILIKGLSPVSRLYFGSEFCAEVLSEEGELREACRLVESHSLALTLCTPPVTEGSLNRLLALLELLGEKSPTIEVVVNDWGVLKALQSYPFPLSAGRTFQKNKRDPRISTLWSKLSPEMRAFYSGNNLLHPSFFALLKDYRISRLEMDLPPWGIDASLFRGIDLPVSLHLSGTFVTTSRVCPTRAAFSPFPGRTSGERCSRPCLKTAFRLRNPAFASSLVLRGNTYFVAEPDAARTEPAAVPEPSPVDRLVYQSPLTEVSPHEDCRPRHMRA